MAVRVHDGVDDFVTFSPSFSLPGALTVAAVVKRTDTGSEEFIFSLQDDTDGILFEFGFAATSTLEAWDGVSLRNSSFVVSDVTDWHIVAVTKQAGVATPDFYEYDFSADAWQNSVGSGALDDASMLNLVATILGAAGGFGFLSGKVAVAGAWTSALLQTQVEALATNLRTTDWVDHAVTPVWVVEPGFPDQDGPIEDLIGNKDSIAINGTTVTTDDDPPGWTFGAEPEPPLPASETSHVVQSGLRFR
jgi:hypothetical protein